jgi:hypothetical protein
MLAILFSTASLPAAAQSTMLATPWEDRVFAGLTFGVEGGADLVDSFSDTIHFEPATVSSTTSFGADAFIDLMVGARVWRNAGVAIAYHAKNSTGEADLQGSIPHPVFFDRPRTWTDSIDGIDRDESATHLQFGWMLPVKDNLDVFVYIGPSFYRLSQQVISGFTVVEQGAPFTSVVVQPSFEVRKETATGYNLGADATYILYTTERMRLGVGGFLRITGATADVRLSNSSSETDLGGAQFGVGARVRF